MQTTDQDKDWFAVPSMRAGNTADVRIHPALRRRVAAVQAARLYGPMNRHPVDEPERDKRWLGLLLCAMSALVTVGSFAIIALRLV